MKTINGKLFIITLMALILGAVGCDKTQPYPTTLPPAVVHFSTSSSLGLMITDPEEPVSGKVLVGTSDVADTDREFSYTVTSPTGAVSGQHYTISPSSKVTIPAGQAVGEITIQANPDYYPAGVRDTILITLTEGTSTTPVAEFNKRKVVVISGPCDDSDVDISTMSGAFPNSSDEDGSYSVSVSGLVETSATTAKGIITGLWEAIGPVEIYFDWTDAENITVDIPLQATGLNYAAGQPLLIRTTPTRTSTFSVCNQTISLIVDLIVDNYPAPGSAAYYDREYPMQVSR